ncbi:unnamed protein product [Trichobilharzia regenti]|nr:unnamed protein product [Trichobilharzia regenti]
MWINRRYYSTSYCQYVKITLILCYHVFSTQLVLSNDSSSPVDDSSHTLSEKSYSDVHWEYDASRADLWSPKTPLEVWPDFKPIQECDTREFKQFQPSSNKLPSGLNNQFEWTSISVFNSERVKRGHILLGGSFRRQQPDSLEASDTVSPRQNSHVFLCHLDMKSDRDSLLGFGFNENPCTLLEQTSTSSVNDHEFLGASSEALKINQDISLLVYCDPLWRAGSKVPVGRCFSHIVRNGQVQPSLELADFCQTGMQVATPCAAGQSVALSMGNDNSVKTSKSVANLLSNVRLWVGEPLSTPHGRIQILTDLYGSMKLITIPRPENTESMAIGSFFGYALTEDFVTAPGLLNSRQDGNYTNPIHLVGIHLAKSSRESTNGFYGTVDWFPETSRSDQFSGNGMSVLRVHLKGPYIKSVVMGAPYAGDTDKSENQSDTSTTQSITYNRGRIYLFCQSDHGISLKSDMHQVSTAYDYLDGPKGSTNFGFALTNLGDFDGDGNDELAVGAPDLKNAYGYSYIYIIRTLSNCRFDRTPLHRLTSPPGAYDFGAHLPSRAYDLDFNGLNDLVVPISPSKGGEFSQTAIVFASRHTWTAECQFTFPPWLAIRNLLANDIIPVQIMIYFKGGKNKLSRLNQSDGSIFFQSSDLLKFIHQINTDWNSSQLAGQRFSLAGPIKSHLEVKQNQLLVEFNIQAKMNVEDMHDLESDKKTGSGVYLGYRFLQPCYGDQNVIDRNGSCPNGGWLKRPIIDWSKCIAKIPLSRYVCYPRPECESDVGIRVKDVQSGQIVAWGDMIDNKANSATDQNGIITNNNNNVNNNITKNTTGDFIPSTTIDIEYGNTNMSRPQLQIEIYNYGPTKAQGTRMELQFHGNLRFSRLEFDADTSEAGASNSISQSEPLMVEVSENETWVHCPIGTLLAPVVMSDTGSEIIEPSQRFILSTYYDQFMSEDDTNFQNGAGVTINVITGTPDPQPISNTIRFNYRVIHKPRIRISYGPGEISSRMDNRSAPSKRVPGQQQRVLVSDIGPKIEHTLQIEYMGPSNRLKNVTITAAVPIELNPEDAIGGATPPYIVYMFNEIRGTQSHENNALKWIDVRPKLLALGRHNADDTVSKVGTCTIVSSESVINPRGVIPMDVDTRK